MREIHKSKYTQAIPGINRIDDYVQFTHAERCISQFGDGLSQPQKLVLDATNAQQRGRHTKLWCENLNKIAEGGIRDGFWNRDSKVRQWKEHLNKEVDKLAKALEKAEECQREILRTQQYFSDLSRVSDMTSDFRKRIPDFQSGDKIDCQQREEKNSISKANADMQQCTKDIKECQRKMEKARSAMMSEVEAKALTLNINKRCQHPEPILSFPYVPADHSVDQLYHPNSEDDWEKNLDDKIRCSASIREETSDAILRTKALIKDDLSKTADDWYRTSKALQEAVQQDERTQYNIQTLLETIGENISSTRQRIASLYDDLRIQDRGKTLQLWRLQTLTYRPGHDHIRDIPARKLEEELSNIEKKSTFIGETTARNKNLLKDLQDEKIKQSLLLEKITKKLFIEKENCLGLRRTVTIEGVQLNNYVTAL